MLRTIATKEKRLRRAGRSRTRMSGTAALPRVTVFRSLTAIYAQAIDDAAGQTIAQANLKEIKEKNTLKGATGVGKLLGDKLKAKGVEQVVFDRTGYRYHGKVKALADGIREAGIIC